MTTTTAQQTTEPVPVATKRRTPRRDWRGKARKGRKGVLIYLDPKLAKQIRQLALDEDGTVQVLGHEVLESLLAQRGEARPPEHAAPSRIEWRTAS